MAYDLKKLQAVAKPESAKEVQEVRHREANRFWLEKSALIALTLERVLRVRGISKKELAEGIGVTPAQISKILSGKENLGLKTICKIEEALHLQIVDVQQDLKPYSMRFASAPTIHVTTLSYLKAHNSVAGNKVLGGFNMLSSKSSIINGIA